MIFGDQGKLSLVPSNFPFGHEEYKTQGGRDPFFFRNNSSIDPLVRTTWRFHLPSLWLQVIAWYVDPIPHNLAEDDDRSSFLVLCLPLA
jgi:hypothetical protein